ncbi:sugar transferase [Salinimicrobium catena]|uniref:sugar transferase n=1 Tax=Salinimicrobium catena TaxID=390640 RepID=UPI002FE4EB7F
MSRRRRMHLEISERKVFLRIFDLIWVFAALYLTSVFFSMNYYRISADFWIWTLVLGSYLMLFSTVFELYDLQKASRYEAVLKNVILTTSVTVLFFLLTPLLTPVLPDNRMQIVYFYLAIAVSMLLWRFTYISLISTRRFEKRVLIIGDSFNVDLISSQLQRADPYYNVIGYVNTAKEEEAANEHFKPGIYRYSAEDLTSIIRRHKVDEILISDIEPEAEISDLNEQIFVLLKRGFPIRDYSMVYEEKTHRIPVQHIERNFYKFFRFSSSNDNKFYLFFHRTADIFLSILGLIIGALLIPFIYLGNLIANPGPLFYKQKRVGKNGEVFDILKFRTMPCNAEPNGAQWTKKNDGRVTRFGKFLRRSRIDEFPQFYNIIKGEMSMIGPRPERPVFVEELSELIPYYDTRHFIKPGLTGWAQVMTDYADSHADSLEKLQYDLYYIKHRNVFLDITILVKTLSTIIFFRGQ